MTASYPMAGSSYPVLEQPLPAELRHVLAAFPQPIEDRAGETVRVALADRLANGTPHAWGGSGLTGDGFPVEVAFCTADDRLRLTLEPGFGVDAAHRLEAVGDVMLRAGGVALPGSMRRRLAALQALGPLHYGAWLGCRFSQGEPAFKVYAEVPLGRDLGPGWAVPLVLPDRYVVPRMVALGPTGDAVEVYVRAPSLLPEHLPTVLDPVGLTDRSAWLLAYLEEAYGHRIRARIPGPSVGVSYVTRDTPRVSLHLYARAMWGGDARIRRGFLRCARALGWDSRAYEEVSAPLARRDEWRTFHGLLGITLPADGQPALTIGLRPLAP